MGDGPRILPNHVLHVANELLRMYLICWGAYRNVKGEQTKHKFIVLAQDIITQQLYKVRFLCIKPDLFIVTCSLVARSNTLGLWPCVLFLVT